MAAKATLTISLATKPTNVRVTIDRVKIDGGSYIDTPTKISLNPGRHEIKIARDGYTAHLV
ncbi:PEGA domain-containing protein, partial [Klebsiella pneumoniae]